MIASNTMRFCTDEFGMYSGGGDDDSGGEIISAFAKTALLVAKSSWNFNNVRDIVGFNVEGAQPVNTDIRFMFKVDGTVYKFNGTTLTEFNGNLDANSVLANGNTRNELTALTNIPDFVGKRVSPICALKAPADNPDGMPTMKLTVKYTAANDKLVDTQESDVINLVEGTAKPVISTCEANTTLKGDASVDVLIRLYVDNVPTQYMSLSEAIGQEAQAVQFQITYKVTKTDGSDSAKLNSIVIEHTQGKAVVSDGTADIYTTVADYDNDLQMCYAVIRHEPLKDADITCYVNFMQPPKTRSLVPIGTGNGSRLEFVLGLDGTPDERIDTSSIKLYQDGLIITNYSYNSATSTVTLNTKKNAAYTASYKYNHGVEEWRQMTLQEREPFNDETGTVTSRFSYKLDGDFSGLSTSNVKIHLQRKKGSVKNGAVATCTGKKQMHVFYHRAKESTIKFTPDIGDDNWTFDEETNILTFVGSKGTELKASYSWVGEDIVIHSVAVGWACA